jgi:hypothetical protein
LVHYDVTWDGSKRGSFGEQEEEKKKKRQFFFVFYRRIGKHGGACGRKP